jgi:hypothetical protein
VTQRHLKIDCEWGTSNLIHFMPEQHPSISAVGSHLDEETEIATLAYRYYEELPRGAFAGPLGARRARGARANRFAGAEDISVESTSAEALTEEMMHRDQ